MWPVVLLLLGSIVMSLYSSLFYVGLMLFSVGFLLFLSNMVSYYFSVFEVTKHSIRVRLGVLVRQIINVPYGKIEMIDLRQNILGSLLGYGTVIIIGTGGTRNVIHNIAKPLACRRYIEQYMNEQQK
jgi:membrane protein YdbS with pleckstrin-like domain